MRVEQVTKVIVTIVIIGQDGSTCDSDSGSGDGMSDGSVKQDSDENVGIDKDGWGTYSSNRKSGGDDSGDSFFYIFLFLYLPANIVVIVIV